MLDLNYDSKYDVLYIGLGDRKNSIGCEEYDGFVIFRDRKSREITGITIMGFLRKLKMKNMPEFPNEVLINIDQDVLPFISLPQ